MPKLAVLHLRSEVAERLRCPSDTVKRLARLGLLTERHVGPRLVRYLPEDVAALEGRVPEDWHE